MSFYNILRESAVQTPDDIGNDLDQIEKDIFEDRDDEAEVASNGVLNDDIDDFDPVSEGYMIMYESLYNHNQLLRAIGIHELNEAYHGRELILEAADVKVWFENIKKIFVNAFTKIANVFKTVIEKLNFAAESDKQFVKKYEKLLEKNKNIEWEFEGYKYPNFRDAKGAVQELAKELNIEIEVPEAYGDDFKTVTLSSDIYENGGYQAMYDIITKIINRLNERDMNKVNSIKLVDDFLDRNRDKMTTDNTKDFANNVLEIFRGGKEKVKITNKDTGFSVDELKAFLTTNRDLKYIKEAYGKVKSQYDELLKEIKKLQDTIKNDEYSKTNAEKADLKLKVCDVFVTFARLANNRTTSANTAMMKCARERRSQAKAILKTIISNANANGQKVSTEPEQTANHESVFARLR